MQNELVEDSVWFSKTISVYERAAKAVPKGEKYEVSSCFNYIFSDDCCHNRERERDRERDRDRQTDRQTETDRQREKDRERQREWVEHF